MCVCVCVCGWVGAITAGAYLIARCLPSAFRGCTFHWSLSSWFKHKTVQSDINTTTTCVCVCVCECVSVCVCVCVCVHFLTELMTTLEMSAPVVLSAPWTGIAAGNQWLVQLECSLH